MKRIYTYTILFIFAACTVTAVSAQKATKATTKPVNIFGDDDFSTLESHIKNYDKQTITLRVQRTLYANSWSTFCSPFTIPASNFDAGSPNIKIVDKVAEFEGYENGVLKFKTGVTTLQAGVPYLIHNNSNVSKGNGYFNIENLTINMSELSSTPKEAVYDIFQGTYVQVKNNDASNNNWWYLTIPNDGIQYFKKLAANGTIMGFRAYFKMPANFAASRLGMSVDGELTGIEGLKITVDGKPIDNNIYTTDGVFAGITEEGLSPGIYVRNGQKFIVK